MDGERQDWGIRWKSARGESERGDWRLNLLKIVPGSLHTCCALPSIQTAGGRIFVLGISRFPVSPRRRRTPVLSAQLRSSYPSHQLRTHAQWPTDSSFLADGATEPPFAPLFSRQGSFWRMRIGQQYCRFLAAEAPIAPVQPPLHRGPNIELPISSLHPHLPSLINSRPVHSVRFAREGRYAPQRSTGTLERVSTEQPSPPSVLGSSLILTCSSSSSSQE